MKDSRTTGRKLLDKSFKTEKFRDLPAIEWPSLLLEHAAIEWPSLLLEHISPHIYSYVYMYT